MFKLIVLDFDGTLADTREIIVQTNQEVMRRMGYPVLDERTIMDTVGLPLEECIRVMFPELPVAEIPNWVKVYREVFEGLRGKIIPKLFPGVFETLEQLHSEGYLLSVASSRMSGSLNDFLREMGIAPFITYVLGAEDVERAKPHPEPVLKTLSALGASAPEALVIGDMPVGIAMGSGAGAKTCGVSFGNSSRPALEAAGADWVIDSFSELVGILAH